MHLEGVCTLSAARLEVWNFVSTPELIAKCLPGLMKFEKIDEKSFKVTVKVGISFVRGDFNFTFNLLDQTPPSHSQFEAYGKSAGVSVHLNSSIDLREIDISRTELLWRADSAMEGLLTELSPSLLQSSTKKFTQDFFNNLKAKLERNSD